jgi:hypothetical protein
MGRVWCQNDHKHRFWHRKGVKNDMVLCKIQRKMMLNFIEENDKFEQMHKNRHRHTITQSKCSQNGRVSCQNDHKHRFWHRNCRKNDMLMGGIDGKTKMKKYEKNDNFEQMNKNRHRRVDLYAKWVAFCAKMIRSIDFGIENT